MSDYSPNKVLSGTLWILGGRTTRLLIVLLAHVALARRLDISDYGLFAYSFSLSALLAQFIDLGIAPSAGRVAAKSSYKGMAEIRTSLSTALIMKLASGVLVILTLTAFIIAIPHLGFAMQITIPMLIAVVVYSYSITFIQLFEQVLQGIRMQHYLFYIVISSHVLTNIATVIATLLVRNPVTIFWVMTIAMTQSVLISLFVITRCVGHMDFRLDRAEMRNVFDYMLPMMLVMLSGVVYTRTSSVALGYFGHMDEVGIFNIPLMIIERLVIPVGAFGAAVGPIFAGVSADSAGEVLGRALQRGTFIILGIAGAAYATSADVIPLFFGEKYMGSIPVINHMLPYMVMLALLLIASYALDYAGVTRQRSVIIVLSAALNLILVIIFVQGMGIEGAVIAPQIGFAFYLAGVLWLCHVKFNMQIKPLLLNFTLSAFCCLPGILIVWSASRVLPQSNMFVQALWKAAVFGASYILLCITLKVIDPSDLRKLKSLPADVMSRLQSRP